LLTGYHACGTYNGGVGSGGSRWLVFCYLLLSGVLLLLLPWSRAWGTLAWSLPPPWARILAHPGSRGAVSGYGLLHLLVAWSVLAEREGKR